MNVVCSSKLNKPVVIGFKLWNPCLYIKNQLMKSYTDGLNLKAGLPLVGTASM